MSSCVAVCKVEPAMWTNSVVVQHPKERFELSNILGS